MNGQALNSAVKRWRRLFCLIILQFLLYLQRRLRYCLTGAKHRLLKAISLVILKGSWIWWQQFMRLYAKAVLYITIHRQALIWPKGCGCRIKYWRSIKGLVWIYLFYMLPVWRQQVCILCSYSYMGMPLPAVGWVKLMRTDLPAVIRTAIKWCWKKLLREIKESFWSIVLIFALTGRILKVQWKKPNLTWMSLRNSIML